MRKKYLIPIICIVFIVISNQVVLADNKGAYDKCGVSDTCPSGFSCQSAYPDPNNPNYAVNLCQPDKFQGVFGKIETPDALKGLMKDPSGAGGLSQFFSNLIALFYSIAAVVLVFMLVWGAFDWLTSEGDKEKIASARNKIINALIGIMLFAAAFGIIRVLGQFTGFTFFVGQ